MAIETVRFLLRRGTAADWQTLNPVLGTGEPGVATDVGVLKLGDGSTPWNSLPSIGAGLSGGGSGKADLVNGKVPVEQIPAEALPRVVVVGSQTAMLALEAQVGDLAFRSDLGYQGFVLQATPASTVGNWRALAPAADLTQYVTVDQYGQELEQVRAETVSNAELQHTARLEFAGEVNPYEFAPPATITSAYVYREAPFWGASYPQRIRSLDMWFDGSVPAGSAYYLLRIRKYEPDGTNKVIAELDTRVTPIVADQWVPWPLTMSEADRTITMGGRLVFRVEARGSNIPKLTNPLLTLGFSRSATA